MPERALRQPTACETAVPSPCIRACCLDDSDTCRGCFRTLQEIAAWSTSSDSTKRRILARAAQRRGSSSDA